MTAAATTGRENVGDDPLRRLLARALRRNGWRRLTSEDEHDYALEGEFASVALLSVVPLGLVLLAGERLGWALWTAALLLFLVMLAAAALSLRVPSAASRIARVVYWTLTLTWFAAGLALLVVDGLTSTLLTHGLPIGIVIGSIGTWRAVRVALGVPIVLPVALIIVLLPLLTEDLWVIAAGTGWGLARFAALAVGLPLALVIVRQVRTSVPEAFSAAVGRLSSASAPEEDALALLGREGQRAEAGLDDAKALGRMRDAYRGPSPRERGAKVASMISSRFKRQTVLRRLLPLTLGTAVLVAILIYVLAWAVVPIPVVEGWTSTVERTRLDLLFAEVRLPLSPYLEVATLLGIVATVGFLAFVLTDDRYSQTLSRALVDEPAERCLLLALAYAHIGASSGDHEAGGSEELELAK